MLSETGVRLLVPWWHQIQSGFGLKIWKTGLDLDSKKIRVHQR